MAHRHSRLLYYERLKMKNFAFLGWVLEFSFADAATESDSVSVFRWTEKNALAMLAENKTSFFCTKLKEVDTQPVPENIAKKIFKTWADVSADVAWTARAEDKPKINKLLIPISIKYWSDKYNNSNGSIYFHEFNKKNTMGFGFSEKTKNPVAIFVDKCKITRRGIE